MFLYHIVMEPDDNDTVMVTAEAFPEVVTFGENAEAARHHAVLAIEEAIAARIIGGNAVPYALDATTLDPQKPVAKIGLQASIKVLLYRALRDEKITRAELARRLGWHREQVDRLFRLDHASRLDQFDVAFQALGRDLDLNLRNAA